MGEVIHTVIEGPFQPDVNGIRHAIMFAEGSNRDKRVVPLKPGDTAVEATGHNLDQMLCEGLSVKCISGDGAGKIGTSGKSPKMLVGRWVRWRSSPPEYLRATGSWKGPSSRS